METRLRESNLVLVGMVYQNPGISRDKLINEFEGKEFNHVNRMIGQLLREDRAALEEINGKLYLIPSMKDEYEEYMLAKEAENERATQYAQTPNAGKPRVVPFAERHEQPSSAPNQQTQFFQLTYAAKRATTLPDAFKKRHVEVTFQLEFPFSNVKRIGISPTQDEKDIVWLPPGSSSLVVKVGRFKPDQYMELVNNYLAVVIPTQGGGYELQFYHPPNGESFALAWVHEDEEDDD